MGLRQFVIKKITCIKHLHNFPLPDKKGKIWARRSFAQTCWCCSVSLFTTSNTFEISQISPKLIDKFFIW